MCCAHGATARLSVKPMGLLTALLSIGGGDVTSSSCCKGKRRQRSRPRRYDEAGARTDELGRYPGSGSGGPFSSFEEGGSCFWNSFKYSNKQAVWSTTLDFSSPPGLAASGSHKSPLFCISLLICTQQMNQKSLSAWALQSTNKTLFIIPLNSSSNIKMFRKCYSKEIKAPALLLFSLTITQKLHLKEQLLVM